MQQTTNHTDYFRTLVARGGPQQADYSEFDRRVREIHEAVQDGRLPGSELESMRQAFGASFSPATMQGFAFCKPHGYAGDYEIIDRIYQRYVCPEPQLAAWDHYWQEHAAAHAVRNRKSYFHGLLDRHSRRCPALRVLKIASGPGRSMFEWMRSNPDANVRFECVELDPLAISYAARLNHDYLDRVTFVQKNALRYRPDSEYDLIWAAGIFDYFNDRIFQNLLQRLLPAVRKGGELVVGNFADTNPSRPYMELFDWVLHHRSAGELRGLAEQCGAAPERIRVGCEPSGVNLFLHVAAA